MSACHVCTELRTAFTCGACDFQACQECHLKWSMENIEVKLDKELPICMKCNLHVPNVFSAAMQRKLEDAKAAALLKREEQWVRVSEAFIANEERKNQLKLKVSEEQGEILRMQSAMRNMRKRMISSRAKVASFEQEISAVHRQTLCEICQRPCANQFCVECKVLHCANCNQVHDPSVSCDHEMKESFREIQRSCRPCPTCHSATAKTGGCDHVKCSNCGTDWDWRTCKAVSVHSENRPYLEEYCGGLPSEHAVLKNIGKMDAFYQGMLWSFYKFTFHQRQHVMPGLADANIEHTPQCNQVKRALYIQKKISKQKFKCAVMRTRKHKKVKYELSLLVKTFVVSSEDIFQGVVCSDAHWFDAIMSLHTLFVQYQTSCHQLQKSSRVTKFLLGSNAAFKELISYVLAFSSSFAIEQCTRKGQKCSDDAGTKESM